MSKVMITITIACLVLTAIAAALFCCLDIDIFLTLAITFGTVFYHFGARLTVGYSLNLIMKNRVDYTKRRYKVRAWEVGLYEFLRVGKWKRILPTYNPDSFSPRKHSWEEIARAMCIAETVHEVCAIISFVPLIAVIWFGAFLVFLITSVCGALLDLVFVAVQRYNRQRVLRVIDAKRQRRVEAEKKACPACEGTDEKSADAK